MAITKKPFVVLTSSAVVGSLLLAGTAFAQTQPTPTSAPTGGWGRSGMMRKMPGVFGTVSAISGNTVTVSQTRMGRPDQTQESAPTIYSVDASNATITKNGSASSLSAIAVGDTVMVQGTVNGTSVTATAIRDGMPQGLRGEGTPGTRTMRATIQGNGQPVVGGTVSAINGNSFTLGTKAGISYSVDASSATVIKQGATSTLSAISTGDAVVVQGAVNGTAITASSVMDQGAPRTLGANGTAGGHPAGGLMGMIGGFFQHLFGFF